MALKAAIVPSTYQPKTHDFAEQQKKKSSRTRKIVESAVRSDVLFDINIFERATKTTDEMEDKFIPVGPRNEVA